jgi:hypothetical protein
MPSIYEQAGAPLSIDQWFAQGGKASSADSGAADEPAYARYLEDFYANKYGTENQTYDYDNRMGSTYEQILADMDPSNVNRPTELPDAVMTPERIKEVMTAAYNSGDFLSGFEGALNPEEKAAYVAMQQYKPGWDGFQLALMALGGAGFAALVGPSIMASLGSNAVGGAAGGSVAGGGGAGLSAADIAGLTQMGQAAGLSGDALASFVAQGGSAAAVGTGVTAGSSILDKIKGLFTPSGGFGGGGTDATTSGGLWDNVLKSVTSPTGIASIASLVGRQRG